MKAEEKNVTLTTEEWNTLELYLMTNTKSREKELDSWKWAAEQKNADGSPKFKNAKSALEFYGDLFSKIEKIIHKIDEELTHKE